MWFITNRFVREMKKFCFLLLIHFITLPVVALADNNEETRQEYNLKAVFIYNFSRYIQWNEVKDTGPFEIAVIGDSEIINPLNNIAVKKLVNDRKIFIKHFQDISDINSCHILFIPESKIKHMDEILEKVKQYNTLTIADSEGAAVKGVAINFVMVKEKIKFELNSLAIDRVGLKVSSQLKKIAILVGEE